VYSEHSEEILRLIENISPHAKDYVNRAFENKIIEVVYFTLTEQNKGVFLIVEDDDCCIFYASFLNEANIEQVLNIIKDKTNDHILKTNSKEICFNVYGENLKIIKLVSELGFKMDMEGFYFEYTQNVVPVLNDYNLVIKGFESNMLKEVVSLFDSSYYQLHKDNGWEINSYSIHEEGFHSKLNQLNKNGQVCSFWLNNEIVGAYIFQQNYITDIVVKPIYQSKGYGNYMKEVVFLGLLLLQSIHMMGSDIYG
jgi:hypothetical protein